MINILRSGWSKSSGLFQSLAHDLSFFGKGCRTRMHRQSCTIYVLSWPAPDLLWPQSYTKKKTVMYIIFGLLKIDTEGLDSIPFRHQKCPLVGVARDLPKTFAEKLVWKVWTLTPYRHQKCPLDGVPRDLPKTLSSRVTCICLESGGPCLLARDNFWRAPNKTYFLCNMSNKRPGKLQKTSVARIDLSRKVLKMKG